MIASKLLKFIMQFGLVCAQLFGVWPYQYNQKSESFENTKLLRCYTAFIVPFILFAYVFDIETITVNKDESVHIPSSIGRLTTVFLGVFIIVAYVVTSVNQIMNYNSINRWLKKARAIMRKIHDFKGGYELPFS